MLVSEVVFVDRVQDLSSLSEGVDQGSEHTLGGGVVRGSEGSCE